MRNINFNTNSYILVFTMRK